MAAPPNAKPVNRYLVRGDSGSRGAGLFAACPITRGSPILTDSCLFSVLKDSDEASWAKSIISEYTKLSKKSQREYLELKCNQQQLAPSTRDAFIAIYPRWRYTNEHVPRFPDFNTAVKILEIFCTNNCKMLDTFNYCHVLDYGNGIFPTYSRINHSCTPNSCWRYNQETNEVLLTPMKDLSQGEEVTIAYYYTRLPYAERIENLKFDCNCPTCNIQNRQESDTRRTQIKTLHNFLYAYIDRVLVSNSWIDPTAHFPALLLAQQYAALLRAENLLEYNLQAYEASAFFHIRCSNKAQAKEAILLAVEENVTLHGGKSTTALKYLVSQWDHRWPNS